MIATEARGRMLLFEVGSARYAIPIEGVREVAELSGVCCIPGLPRSVAGVANWHGDALPIVSSRRIFAAGPAVDAESPAIPTGLPLSSDGGDVEASAGQVLVLSDGDDDRAQLGLPVDRVLGLIDGVAPRGSAHRLVVARQPVDGRVVNVLDPGALWSRAESVIAEGDA